MATRKSSVKSVQGKKNYGAGEHDANPWFPTEKMFNGEKYTIESPFGSVFEPCSVQDTNDMDRVIKETARAGGAGKRGK